jgi:hypothetical protein
LETCPERYTRLLARIRIIVAEGAIPASTWKGVEGNVWRRAASVKNVMAKSLKDIVSDRKEHRRIMRRRSTTGGAASQASRSGSTEPLQ